MLLLRGKGVQDTGDKLRVVQWNGGVSFFENSLEQLIAVIESDGGRIVICFIFVDGGNSWNNLIMSFVLRPRQPISSVTQVTDGLFSPG